MSFDYATMSTKYTNLTGELWDRRGMHYVSDLGEHTTMVVCSPDADLSVIRDWCQDNFGDDWIYRWNEFFFKHEADATLFKLKWP